jgi:hypothetical protein
MLEGLIEDYEAALAEPFEAKSSYPPMIGAVLGEAARRTWKHLAAERLNGSKPEIPICKTFWPVSRTERRELEALCLSLGPRSGERSEVTGQQRRDRSACGLLDEGLQLPGALALCRAAAPGGGDGAPDICGLDLSAASRSTAGSQSSAWSQSAAAAWRCIRPVRAAAVERDHWEPTWLVKGRLPGL